MIVSVPSECRVTVQAHPITAQHYLKNNNPYSILSIGVNDENRHAEVDAILKLKYRKDKLKHPIKISVLVIRVSTTGVLGMSRPCMHCTHALYSLPKKSGYIVKDVYYSDEDGNILKTTMTDLLMGPQHISHGNRS